MLESSADRIYLCHDAKSRRGFAEGAVRAAEWLAGKKGFYDFKDVWRELLDTSARRPSSCLIQRKTSPSAAHFPAYPHSRYPITMQLRGCGTALVTPFHQDGSIDDAALRNLVAWQIESRH